MSGAVTSVDFGHARVYRATKSGARVRPKRLSSFLVLSCRLTDVVGATRMSSGQQAFQSRRPRTASVFSHLRFTNELRRNIQASTVKLILRRTNFRIQVHDRSVICYGSSD